MDYLEKMYAGAARKATCLETIYNECIRRSPDDSDKQSNPLNLPIGFHWVETARGEAVGLGFYCPACKLHIPSHAPDQVKHCRAVSEVPTVPTGLRRFWPRTKINSPTRRIAANLLYGFQ